MCAAYRRNDRIGELWAVALDDAASATEAEVAIVVSGPATGGGSIALYIGGRRLEVAVGIGRHRSRDRAGHCDGRQWRSRSTGHCDRQRHHRDDHGTQRRNCDKTSTCRPIFNRTRRTRLVSHWLLRTCGRGDDTGYRDRYRGDRRPSIQSDRVGIHRCDEHDGARGRTRGALGPHAAERWTGHRGVPRHACGDDTCSATAEPPATSPRWDITTFLIRRGSSRLPWPVPSHRRLPLILRGRFKRFAVQGILAPRVENRWDFTERNVILTDGVSTFNTVGDQVRLERLLTTDQGDTSATTT